MVLRDNLEAIKQMRFVEGKTLQEIANVYGVSRERIRQLIGNTGVRDYFLGDWRLSAGGTSRSGQIWERWFADKLKTMGYDAKLMPYNCPFDILVNSHIRIDVKSTNKEHVVKYHQWRFHLNCFNKDSCDLYVFVIAPTREVFLIPRHRIHNYTSLTNLCITWPSTSRSLDLSQYYNNYDWINKLLLPYSTESEE